MADIIGTTDADTLVGTPGDDTISASAGNDVIRGSAGTDSVDGGGGYDILDLALSNAALFPTAPGGTRTFTITDTRIVETAGLFDTGFGGIESLQLDLRGTAITSATINASAVTTSATQLLYYYLADGSTTVTGSASRDAIISGLGYLAADGGAGLDSAVLRVRQDAGTITLSRSGGSIVATQNGTTIATLTAIEQLWVTTYDFPAAAGLSVDATGLDFGVTFIDLSGSDTYRGGTASDLFRRGLGSSAAGVDVYTGGGGADLFDFRDGTAALDATTITDFDADDQIFLAIANYAGRDDFSGAGNETRYYTSAGRTYLQYDADGDRIADATLTLSNGEYPFSVAYSGSYFTLRRGAAAVISGTDGAETLTGTGADEQIGGLGGNDSLDGGAGDDVLYGDAGNDTLIGGAGRDSLYGGASDDTLDGGPGGDSLYGGAGADRLTEIGGPGDFNGQPLVLDGGPGADIITAANGMFLLLGNGDHDDTAGDQLTITNALSNSRAVGGNGDDLIRVTGSGRLWVFGEDGDDDISVARIGSAEVRALILGGAGDDVIRFPAGAVTLSGDGGVDTLILGERLFAGSGIGLNGFAAGEAGDRLDLSVYGTDPFGAGGLALSQRGDGAVITDASNSVQINFFGVDARNLSAYNLGAVNPLYAPQDQVLEDSSTLDVDSELIGADGNDQLSGYGGDDILRGGGGADRLRGGDGDDQMFGGSGVDVLVGGTGDDLAFGGGGRDELYGDNGSDALFGEDGADALYGADGTDLLDGGADNDRISGGAGADLMLGGTGDDAFFVDQVGDVVVELAGEGNDTVYATGSFALSGVSSVETLTVYDRVTTDAIDLTGNALAQRIIGNNGVNALRSGGGADTLYGLGGNDGYVVEDTAAEVIEAAGGGNDTVYTTVSFTLTRGNEVEVLTAYDRSATDVLRLTGNNLAQTIIGNAGANLLSGGGGIDILYGLGGDDAYIVDETADRVIELAGQGNDTVYTYRSYVLAAGAEVETLTVYDRSTTNALNLTGNEFAQRIIGNNGANGLRGGGGADVLYGLGGDDSFVIDDAAAQVLEFTGGGRDTVYATVSFALGADADVEVLTAYDRADAATLNLAGNATGQTIYGNAGTNFLSGGGGADVLYGLGGDDAYLVDGPDDQVLEFAGGGTDTVYATGSFALGRDAAVETLTVYDRGTVNTLALTGSDTANRIIGNDGANVIDGKGGGDTLYGLGGADTFAFSTALGGGNVDEIVGFVSGGDRIQLSAAIFTALTPGALAAGAFVRGTAAADADDRILYDQATGRLFYDADGTGTRAAVPFATLSAGTALAAGDVAIL